MRTPCQRGQGPGCESWRSCRGLAAPARTLVKMAPGPPRAPGTAACPLLPTCLQPLGKQRLPRPGPKRADAGQGLIQACGGLEPAVFKEQADTVCTGWGGGGFSGSAVSGRPGALPAEAAVGKGSQAGGAPAGSWLVSAVCSPRMSHGVVTGPRLSGFAWLPWFFSLSCPWPLLQSSDRLLSSL